MAKPQHRAKADYIDHEVERRRDELVRRALKTPPQPMSGFIGKSAVRKGRIKKSGRRAP
jgi:hypothetical protein